MASIWAGKPRNLGSIPSKGKRSFSSPKCPDNLWGLLDLLCNGHSGSFLQVVKLITHLQLVLRLKMYRVYCHSPTCLSQHVA
jgi:hypothetical protein